MVHSSNLYTPLFSHQGNIMQIQDAQAAVGEFHQAIGVTISDRPMLLSNDSLVVNQIAIELRDLSRSCLQVSKESNVLAQRLGLELEELAEWCESHAAGDLVAAADALGDRFYVLLGDAVATGLPLEKIFQEVHRSNMTKCLGQQTATGKGLKGESFEPPKFEWLNNS